jgi:hypothetical protein
MSGKEQMKEKPKTLNEKVNEWIEFNIEAIKESYYEHNGIVPGLVLFTSKGSIYLDIAQFFMINHPNAVEFGQNMIHQIVSAMKKDDVKIYASLMAGMGLGVKSPDPSAVSKYLENNMPKMDREEFHKEVAEDPNVNQVLVISVETKDKDKVLTIPVDGEGKLGEGKWINDKTSSLFTGLVDKEVYGYI